MGEIVFYVASDMDYFLTPACIDTNVSNFCACTGADLIDGIKEVLEGELLEIGGGIKVSKLPRRYDLIESEGKEIFGSLSHDGIFAACFKVKRPKKFKGGPKKGKASAMCHIVRMTNIKTGKYFQLEIENDTMVGFYDNMCIFITYNQVLRECDIDYLSRKPLISSLKGISGTMKACPWTDVTKLNNSRLLFYRTPVYIPYVYDVGRKKNIRLFERKKVYTFASTTGIRTLNNCFFQEYENGYKMFALGRLNSSEDKLEPVVPFSPLEWLVYNIPSETNPNDAIRSMKLYNNSLFYVSDINGMDFNQPLRFQGYHSIVRVYKDVFLVYDNVYESWNLLRIVVP